MDKTAYQKDGAQRLGHCGRRSVRRGHKAASERKRGSLADGGPRPASEGLTMTP